MATRSQIEYTVFATTRPASYSQQNNRAALFLDRFSFVFFSWFFVNSQEILLLLATALSFCRTVGPGRQVGQGHIFANTFTPLPPDFQTILRPFSGCYFSRLIASLHVCDKRTAAF